MAEVSLLGSGSADSEILFPLPSVRVFVLFQRFLLRRLWDSGESTDALGIGADGSSSGLCCRRTTSNISSPGSLFLFSSYCSCSVAGLRGTRMFMQWYVDAVICR